MNWLLIITMWLMLPAVTLARLSGGGEPITIAEDTYLKALLEPTQNYALKMMMLMVSAYAVLWTIQRYIFPASELCNPPQCAKLWLAPFILGTITILCFSRIYSGFYQCYVELELDRFYFRDWTLPPLAVMARPKWGALFISTWLCLHPAALNMARSLCGYKDCKIITWPYRVYFYVFIVWLVIALLLPLLTG